MARRKKGSIIPAVAAFAGIVAVVLFIFIDLIVLKTPLSETKFSGLQIVFGYQERDVQILDFSILALVTLLLLVSGTILALVNLLSPKRLTMLITTALLLVSSVLIFFMPQFIVFSQSTSWAIALGVVPNLTAGAIITGIIALLGAGVSGYGLVVK